MLFRIQAICWLIILAVSSPLARSEVFINELSDKKIGDKKQKSMRGNSFSIWGGVTQGQDGRPVVDMTPFGVDDRASDFIMGFDIDYWWKMKKFPIQTGIGFEGSFMATELAATRDFLDTSVVPPAEASDSFSANANGAIFLLNAHIALDLHRYRARLRGLSRLKPYVGGGVGGAQFWFRDTVTMYDPSSTVMSTPFAVDEFVFAYKYFAGVEVMVNEKVSVFAEYQNYFFDGLDNVKDLEVGSWVGGIKLIYEAKTDLEEEEE
ncbi:MAG: hypothetical protein AAGA58_14760 [Verrucomicrobiota bacterium]